MICGLPGIGKTTLAKEISPLINAEILSTDKIRKELIPKPTYEKSERALIYDVLTLVAKYLHKAGKNCILDATFNKEKSRQDIIKKLGLPLSQVYIVECTCPEDTIISRLQSRKNDWSDAGVEVYKNMKEIYEPVMVEHITADTSKPPKTIAKQVVQLIHSK
jgi:predicted kinase